MTQEALLRPTPRAVEERIVATIRDALVRKPEG
jgi:hypothetical protein